MWLYKVPGLTPSSLATEVTLCSGLGSRLPPAGLAARERARINASAPHAPARLAGRALFTRREHAHGPRFP
jgi:hypothetical protein